MEPYVEASTAVVLVFSPQRTRQIPQPLPDITSYLLAFLLGLDALPAAGIGALLLWFAAPLRGLLGAHLTRLMDTLELGSHRLIAGQAEFLFPPLPIGP